MFVLVMVPSSTNANWDIKDTNAMENNQKNNNWVVGDGVSADSTNILYASMWNFTEGGYVLEISASETYYNVTDLSLGESYGVDFIDGHALLIQKSGEYKIDAQVSALFGNNGEYGFGVTMNGMDLERSPYSKCYARIDGSGKYQIVSITCIQELEKGDIITMMIDDEATPTQDITIKSANLNIVRLGSIR